MPLASRSGAVAEPKGASRALQGPAPHYRMPCALPCPCLQARDLKLYLAAGSLLCIWLLYTSRVRSALGDALLSTLVVGGALATASGAAFYAASRIAHTAALTAALAPLACGLAVTFAGAWVATEFLLSGPAAGWRFALPACIFLGEAAAAMLASLTAASWLWAPLLLAALLASSAACYCRKEG